MIGIQNMEKDNLKNLADFLTGEKALRDKEDAILKAKKQAIKDEKDNRRRNIIQRKVQIEEDPVQKKEVIQNIKLFAWESPERFQIKFREKSFLILLAFSLLFIALLAVLGKYYLIAALISVLFVIYAAATTKPLKVKHKITKRGIETAGKLYEWYMLNSFYITKKDGMFSVLVGTKLNFPKMLIMLCKEKDKDAIFVILQKYLLYEDIKKQNKIDIISYGEYIPLEEF